MLLLIPHKPISKFQLFKQVSLNPTKEVDKSYYNKLTSNPYFITSTYNLHFVTGKSQQSILVNYFNTQDNQNRL